LTAVVEGRISPTAVVVRVEPFLNRAVDYGIGEGLFRRAGGDKIVLSTKGHTLADEIDGSEEIFKMEKELMSVIRFGITENLVNHLFGRQN
jgi:hypothetical protein